MKSENEKIKRKNQHQRIWHKTNGFFVCCVTLLSSRPLQNNTTQWPSQSLLMPIWTEPPTLHRHMETQVHQPHHDDALSHIPLISPSSSLPISTFWRVFQECHDCLITDPPPICFFEGFHGEKATTGAMDVLWCSWWWLLMREMWEMRRPTLDQVWLAVFDCLWLLTNTFI